MNGPTAAAPSAAHRHAAVRGSSSNARFVLPLMAWGPSTVTPGSK
jgi:hypothetical protein